MKVSILRQESSESEKYYESYEYFGEMHISVLELISRLNKQESNKNPDFRKIVYECSCEQGLCGACAMVVNNTPGLACQIFCDSAVIKDSLDIRPLSKFPVVCDLMVDRSEIDQYMKAMKIWLEEDAQYSSQKAADQYEAASCLMCGCCLEVCPNYTKGDLFTGAVGAVAAMNLLRSSSDIAHNVEVLQQYKEKFYDTCTKVGACEKVCPSNIATMTLMSDVNRLYIWKLRRMEKEVMREGKKNGKK